MDGRVIIKAKVTYYIMTNQLRKALAIDASYALISSLANRIASLISKHAIRHFSLFLDKVSLWR